MTCLIQTAGSQSNDDAYGVSAGVTIAGLSVGSHRAFPLPFRFSPECLAAVLAACGFSSRSASPICCGFWLVCRSFCLCVSPFLSVLTIYLYHADKEKSSVLELFRKVFSKGCSSVYNDRMRQQKGNVYRRSSDAIEAIMALHFPGRDVIDMTWGKGAFWREYDGVVIGGDLALGAGIRWDATRLPLRDKSVAVAVIDPPFKRGPRNHPHQGIDFLRGRYGSAGHTEQAVDRLYDGMLPEALRVATKGLILKCQDGTDGHSFYPRHIRLADQVRSLTGLEVHDLTMIYSPNKTGTLVQGEQRFFRQHISYLMVWRWTHDFKRVRF